MEVEGGKEGRQVGGSGKEEVKHWEKRDGRWEE